MKYSSSSPGITNYPIGVGINMAGEVTIADNHNNFNLSVFSQVKFPISTNHILSVASIQISFLFSFVMDH